MTNEALLTSLAVSLFCTLAGALLFALAFPMLAGLSAEAFGAAQRTSLRIRGALWAGVPSLLVAANLLPLPLSPRPLATCIAATSGLLAQTLLTLLRSVPSRRLKVHARALFDPKTRERARAAIERAPRFAALLGPTSWGATSLAAAEHLYAAGELDVADRVLRRVDRALCEGGLGDVHDVLADAVGLEREGARAAVTLPPIATLSPGLASLARATDALALALEGRSAEALALVSPWPYPPGWHARLRLVVSAHAHAASDAEPAARRMLHELRRLFGESAVRQLAAGAGPAAVLGREMLGDAV